MSEPTSCCRARGGYCVRCDVLVGLDGLRVIEVERDDGGALTVTVESEPTVVGCPACGVLAHGHGRVLVRLVDAPSMGRPVRIHWRKRRWVCPDAGCPVATFVEQDARVAAPRSSLTARACRWAIELIRREHASVNGIRRQLGTGWRTVWESIKPILAAADADPSRFSCPIPEVARLGRTLKQWRSEFLGYFDTSGASNGGTEAINGLIELHRRVARGFRNRENYRLRMLLIGGGLDPSPHTHR